MTNTTPTAAQQKLTAIYNDPQTWIRRRAAALAILPTVTGDRAVDARDVIRSAERRLEELGVKF